MVVFGLLLIFICVVGGVTVFALYCLLYTLTIKNKGAIKPFSLVVRIPIVTGCVNLLLGILYIFFYLEEIFKTNLSAISGIYVFLVLIALPIMLMYYFILAIPISLAYIVIYFMERKKGLVISYRFGIVALMNSIALIPVFLYILS